ncbi:mevalonate kinase [Streptomyces ficellus]|uniref:mevalonate kinase n=1 Tax=Streptomyces ficellus TaxID=1977088 RepID=A0ABT7Z610_9ACTN|nr:mevalonate kinase [Streptomyces ficellus]MDN3294893.1 mevalonate kinase [Streptomyces ficellus]
MGQNAADAEQSAHLRKRIRSWQRAALPGSGTGTAHGKVILLGEHAVVYGAPALALPVPSLGCRARVACRFPGEGRVVGFRMVQLPPGVPSGPFLPPPHITEGPIPEGLHMVVSALLRRAELQVLPGVDILLESGVPPARGLGSSAACARAVTHALDDLLGLQLSSEAVFECVQSSETAVHGQASGIDALATGSRRPVLLAGGHVSTPAVGADGWIVVVDSGSGASTKEAVAMLRDSFAAHPGSRERFLDHSTALTLAGLRSMAGGRLAELGRRLTDCHQLLAGLGLTTERTDSLVDAALTGGALGAKMSGGGLGGCVIALAATEPEADALAALLLREHGVRCWTTRLVREAEHAGT